MQLLNKFFAAIGLLLCLNGCQTEPVNILFLTADDLNFNSIGVYGAEVDDITPNLDRLASEGIRFTHAHVNIAVCQPSRQSILTGLYPHSNGARGFEPIRDDVVTLNEVFQQNGYLNAILGKERHYQPEHKFVWDYVKTESELASGKGIGRDPEKYYAFSKEFIEIASESGKPFFLHANAHDPHRPYAGSRQEYRSWSGDLPKVTRTIGPAEVAVPNFLPDLPDVRTETAQYFTSVYRCDQVIGAVIKALEETGKRKHTLIIFLSDNGMSFPYAKTNCYLNSTKTPLMFAYTGKIKPGSVDSTHLVSGVDLLPTILDVVGIKGWDELQGRSFLPVLYGKPQAERDYVFTEFHENFAKDQFPMRAIIGRRYGYIINYWSNGETVFQNESKSGLTFPSMRRAGEMDSLIQQRVDFYNYRAPEEFYDLSTDPNALHNLIAHPDYQDQIQVLKQQLTDHMHAYGDSDRALVLKEEGNENTGK